MGNSKFTMNSLNIIVIIFSAILFFFTIAMVNMSSPFAQNEFFPIEGTELAVKHSNLEPDGLYKGPESTATLVLEGTFGNDWGTAVENGKIYLNEYAMTTVGLIVPEAVRVDAETYEKEVLLKNAMIRGKCASGELVVVEGFIMPTNFPKTNSLFKLYCMSDPLMRPDSDSRNILFIDPATGETVLTLEDQLYLEKSFEMKFIDKTLDEIREEAAA